MIYISHKHGPNLCIVSRNIFCYLGDDNFFSVKLQFVTFRTQDTNFVFSDIRHRIKRSLFGAVKFIYPM